MALTVVVTWIAAPEERRTVELSDWIVHDSTGRVARKTVTSGEPVRKTLLPSTTTYDLARLKPIVTAFEQWTSTTTLVRRTTSSTSGGGRVGGTSANNEPRPVRMNGMLCSRGCIKASNPCAIPAYICQRESKYFIDVWNPTENASGKYQFIRSSWNNYGGYRNAGNAPEAVQDAKAAEMWAGGRGCSHWSAC